MGTSAVYSQMRVSIVMSAPQQLVLSPVGEQGFVESQVPGPSNASTSATGSGVQYAPRPVFGTVFPGCTTATQCGSGVLATRATGVRQTEAGVLSVRHLGEPVALPQLAPEEQAGAGQPRPPVGGPPVAPGKRAGRVVERQRQGPNQVGAGPVELADLGGQPPLAYESSSSQ